MKYFALFALFLMIAVQAFALPAAPESVEQHTGAAKGKRAVFYYTAPAVIPSYSAYYSYVPYYSPVAAPVYV